MICSGIEKRQAVGKEIKIEPYDPKKPSVRRNRETRLHDENTVYTEKIVIDMKKPNATKAMRISRPGNSISSPGRLYLGGFRIQRNTRFIPMIEGRSYPSAGSACASHVPPEFGASA